MNDRLKSRIEQLRRALEARNDGMTLGEFRPGMKRAPQWELNPSHEAFLRLSDGGRFGSVDVWSSDELPENQFRAAEKTGGSGDWLEIGQVLYEPIFFCSSDGRIELPQFAGGATRTVSNLDTFMEDYVLGHRYADLFSGAMNDRWRVFLASEPTSQP